MAMLASILAVVIAAPASAQKDRQSDEDFVREKPAVGEMLPDVVVYSPDGKEFKTADLRGHYTVLTFGCLT
jgi:cytochrome oxidase Cu insertion factor (SCO1/SenC/PrrC family)